MKIAVASDHAGLPLKDPILAVCRDLGHNVLYLGAHKLDPADDYPDYSRYIGQAIQHEQVHRGILLSRNGVGACIAASKHKGVRAGMCHDHYSVREGVEHSDINVLCLGAAVVGTELAVELVTMFLNARFSEHERHKGRLEKILAIEAAN